MKPQLKSSRAARDLIRTYEPFRPEAVRRGRRFVVGYGHSATAREGVTVSRDDAELLLIYDVLNAEQAVEQGVSEHLPGPVRDALVSFACSIGPGAFKVSDVARLAKAGRHREAANALETWVRAEEDGQLVVSERLTRRRAAEKALYLKGLQEEAAPAPAPAPEAREDPRESVREEKPRPHPAPPAPDAEPAPQPPVEPAKSELPAGDGDTSPRIGPLVDLEIEFEDPPAEDEMPAVGAPAERIETSQDDSALERALGPEPESEPDTEAVEAAEPALERALGAVEDVKDEPAADQSMAEAVSQEEAEPDTTPAPEPEAAAALDKAEQDEIVQKVMARMARDISESVGMDEPATQPDMSVQLGYSFLEPVSSTISVPASEEPAETVEPALERALGPAEDIKDEPEAKAVEDARGEAKAAPVPVYGSVAVGPTPVRAAPADATPPQARTEPAPAEGFSGEVGGVGRPADIEEIEAHEEEELHPELVAGREAHDLFQDEEMETTTPVGGRWVYAVNMGMGALIAGYGLYDLVTRFEIYSNEPLFSQGTVLGPAFLAVGLMMVVVSGWLLSASGSKAVKHKNDSDEEGVSGEI